ncbi:MAG: hypothetical protein C0502_08520 [Opitutus sp.]|nr:hypothetical protein [Opitutus sp.]
MRAYIVHLAWLALAACTFPHPSSGADFVLPDGTLPGQLSLDLRLRYESATQSGVPRAEALHLRTRLGYTSPVVNRWQMMLEGDQAEVLASDDNALLRTDAYGQPYLSPWRQTAEENSPARFTQAWVAFEGGDTRATLGRQVIALDNERFIGPDNWRLSRRTFDALLVRNTSLADTTVTYAYLWRVNHPSPAPPIWSSTYYSRFSTTRPPREHKIDAHLLNVSYRRSAAAKLTAYAYLIDIGTYFANSTATMGLSLEGERRMSPSLLLGYRLEGALQRGYRTVGYMTRSNTSYAAAQLRMAGPTASLTLGSERLEGSSWSAKRQRFDTPLASSHRFTSWTGMVSFTPGNGLWIHSGEATVQLPAGWTFLTGLAEYRPVGHEVFAYFAIVPPFPHFDYGRARELRLSLSRDFGRHLKGLVKWADFQSRTMLPSARRLWLQLDFAY